MAMRPLGIRWTIGDVSPLGFEALRLSLWGAYRLFGDDAAYAVCVNNVPLDLARERTGDVPEKVIFRDATAELSAFLRPHLDAGVAEGVGWKFAPLQLFPDRYELSLDNDCILWALPEALRAWLHGDPEGAVVLAEDVRPCFGQFASLCGPAPRNSGIRGLPRGFDLEGALRRVLKARPVTLVSELDEQGLQVAALSQDRSPLVVTVDEVTICSPFPPHRPGLGGAGAHFVGLNARALPWRYDDRPASELVREHFQRLRGAVEARLWPAPEPGAAAR
jgi:hypothetical protein